jgi:hypothetical protein
VNGQGGGRLLVGNCFSEPRAALSLPSQARGVFHGFPQWLATHCQPQEGYWRDRRRQLTREKPERWIAPSVDIESIEGSFRFNREKAL